jgi:hypothetical protein
MTLERMRFADGALQGKVVWVETGRATVSVHISGQLPGMTRTLHYRRSGGTLLRFVGESAMAPQSPEGGSNEPGY